MYQTRKIRPDLGEILRYTYNIVLPVINFITKYSCFSVFHFRKVFNNVHFQNVNDPNLPLPTYEAPNDPKVAGNVQKIHVTQQHFVPAPLVEAEHVPRKKSSGNGAGFCICFFGMVGLIGVALLVGQNLKHRFFLKELDNFVDIIRVELETTNFKRTNHLAAGTVILTAKDGSKGIIRDTHFGIMTVSQISIGKKIAQKSKSFEY